jgi:P27 family predicted phage terminase small subunit
VTDINPYEVPEAPAHLHKSGADTWRRIAADLELTDADDLTVLRLACEALDRAEQARRQLRREGLCVIDSKGAPHAHPAAAIEARAATRAAQLLKQLQSTRLAFERLQLAHERAHRAANPPARDRRGGGVRHFGRA